MTITQLEEIGEIWYKRCHRLREIWQSDSESFCRKFKAFVLWNEMKNRVIKITIAIHRALSIRSNVKEWATGGYVNPAYKDSEKPQ